MSRPASRLPGSPCTPSAGRGVRPDAGPERGAGECSKSRHRSVSGAIADIVPPTNGVLHRRLQAVHWEDRGHEGAVATAELATDGVLKRAIQFGTEEMHDWMATPHQLQHLTALVGAVQLPSNPVEGRPGQRGVRRWGSGGGVRQFSDTIGSSHSARTGSVDRNRRRKVSGARCTARASLGAEATTMHLGRRPSRLAGNRLCSRHVRNCRCDSTEL